MKYKWILALLIAGMLVVLAGCAPGGVVQVLTPAPDKGGTSTPSGQIDVPGFKLQITVPGPNPLQNKIGARQNIAGILLGIWHGVISPVTLIMSFINPNMQMYEVHNNGGQYNLGFLIGVALVFLILGVTAGRRRR